jgi:hypothetical protein
MLSEEEHEKFYEELYKLRESMSINDYFGCIMAEASILLAFVTEEEAERNINVLREGIQRVRDFYKVSELPM